jgi:hypothetical protein
MTSFSMATPPGADRAASGSQARADSAGDGDMSAGNGHGYSPPASARTGDF